MVSTKYGIQFKWKIKYKIKQIEKVTPSLDSENERKKEKEISCIKRMAINHIKRMKNRIKCEKVGLVWMEKATQEKRKKKESKEKYELNKMYVFGTQS